MSWTRSFQVPLATSLEALTVYVAMTLSAESPLLEFFSRYAVPSGASRSTTRSPR